MEQYRDAVARARTNLANVHANASSAATATLTAIQRERYIASQQNGEVHGALRYVPGLSSTQREYVVQAQDARIQPQGIVEEARLSNQQAWELSTIRADMATRSDMVARGELAALPVPDAVRAEFDALPGEDGPE